MPTRKQPRSPLFVLPDGAEHTLDLAIPVPDGADPVLWRGRVRLFRQVRMVTEAYFATPNDADPEAQRLLRQRDALERAIAENARAQGFPVYPWSRPVRWEPERERAVFGKKGKVAA